MHRYLRQAQGRLFAFTKDDKSWGDPWSRSYFSQGGEKWGTRQKQPRICADSQGRRKTFGVAKLSHCGHV
jgi:hypothetical protein